MGARILICGTQVPFSHGGAEILVGTLRDELARRGHRVDVVSLPFSWSSRVQILKSALAWRLIDLETVAGERVDLVITTRFPSYAVRHPNKVVWLIHQFRQVYELLGTRYSDFTEAPEDRRAVEMIRALDRRTLGEMRRRFTISGNTAERLERYLGLDATPLYPPPSLGDRYHSSGYGDYLLAVGRLDPMKRFDHLIRALGKTRTPARLVIAGEGPESGALAELAGELGLSERVELPGRVDDERLLELYAGALAVAFAPYDEDYGYVTVEAFKSAKPVITTADAGGVLEFVDEGRTGFVCRPGSARRMAARFDALYEDRTLAERLGEAGRERVQDVTWDTVVDELTATL